MFKAKQVISSFVLLLISSIADATIVIDTGDTNPGVSIGLIRPTSYVFDQDGIKDNGQSLAIQFILNKSLVIDSISSLFSVDTPGSIRFSLFDNLNSQPNNSLYNEILTINKAGWNGATNLNINLLANTYWAIFDFPPEIHSQFNGGLRLYYPAEEIKTFVKSNYSTTYNDLGASMSAGLRVSGVISPIPEPKLMLMISTGLLFMFATSRKYII